MGPTGEATPWYSWLGPVGEAHVIIAVQGGPGDMCISTHIIVHHKLIFLITFMPFIEQKVLNLLCIVL